MFLSHGCHQVSGCTMEGYAFTSNVHFLKTSTRFTRTNSSSYARTNRWCSLVSPAGTNTHASNMLCRPPCAIIIVVPCIQCSPYMWPPSPTATPVMRPQFWRTAQLLLYLIYPSATVTSGQPSSMQPRVYRSHSTTTILLTSGHLSNVASFRHFIA